MNSCKYLLFINSPHPRRCFRYLNMIYCISLHIISFHIFSPCFSSGTNFLVVQLLLTNKKRCLFIFFLSHSNKTKPQKYCKIIECWRSSNAGKSYDLIKKNSIVHTFGKNNFLNEDAHFKTEIFYYL